MYIEIHASIESDEHCCGITNEKSLSQLLSEDSDPIFFPNIRELVCILAVLAIGSAETERSFSCLRKIHSWLCTTMTSERLGNLGILALHGFDIDLNTSKICEQFKSIHPSRMCSPSVLYD